MKLQYLARPMKSLKGVLTYVNIFGMAGLLHALYCVFSRRQKLAQVHHKWSKYPLFIRLNTSDVLVFKQVFIEEEYSVVASGVAPASIIDAGANIGLTCVYLADRYPAARMLAIEPEQGNLDLLKRNISHYAQIEVFHGAIWRADEPVYIDSEDVESWAFRVTGDGDSRRKTQINGQRVGTILTTFDASRPRLLKMDVEGAEFEVLEDAPSWIEAIDSIVIELHENIKPGVTQRFERAVAEFPIRDAKGELLLASKG